VIKRIETWSSIAYFPPNFMMLPNVANQFKGQEELILK